VVAWSGALGFAYLVSLSAADDLSVAAMLLGAAAPNGALSQSHFTPPCSRLIGRINVTAYPHCWQVKNF